MKRHIISALVANHSGVLTRISGLFARRGYNIDSLSVCATECESLSRMTIVALGDDSTIDQIIRQLAKLVDTHSVTALDSADSVMRELLLVKIRIQPSQRPEIESTCNIYRAKLVDLSPETAIIELTGEPGKIDGFVQIVQPYGIIELVRTGLTALPRSTVK